MATEFVELKYLNIKRNTSWPIISDGKYVEVIKEFLLNDGIPPEGVNRNIDNAVKTLSFCPNPSLPDECKKTGIVIGKVQSGKTSNFICLTALAFDNGYNIVILLGGTKKNLVGQNTERVQEYFESVDEDVIVLDTIKFRKQITTENLQQFIEMGKKIVVIALKNETQIDGLAEDVFSTDLSDEPILILDDEGDEASLNTLVKKNKKSSTYRAIENLKNKLRRHCFLSITATPQANLLINTLDILSPDFGVLVDPGVGYCGLDVFHSDETYTVRIDDSEESLLDEGIPASFIDALGMFFVGCGIQKKRDLLKGKKTKFSMLIHPSQLKADHKLVFNKLESIIKNWRNLAINKNDISYQDLRSILLKAYNEYKKTTIPDVFDFEIIEDEILKAITTCQRHMVNGDNVPNGMDKYYEFNIYVGGTMLARGITLKGLAITYIIRTARNCSNVDTVQQRARWFGYKSSYLDLCRIFAVDKIIDDFMSIRDHENDLWETVRMTNREGVNFKDMARIFTLDNGLKMTRGSVACTEIYTFYSWNKQGYIQSDPDLNENNKTILSCFKETHLSEKHDIKIGGGAPYGIIKDLDFAYVKEEILDKFVFPNNAKFNNGVISKLAVLMKAKKIYPKIDVIWMREGKVSNHKIKKDGKIPNYSVGRRPKDLSLEAVYQGDDYHFIRNNMMQLQIHEIKDDLSDYQGPALNLYIPKEIVEQLSNLVIQA